MSVIVALLLASSVSAQLMLPDPPKITVDPQLLQQFGITEDVNRPGLFNSLMSIPPSINSSDPIIRSQGEAAKASVQAIYTDLTSKSAVDVSRSIIGIYRNLPEGPLAQFISAHLINMYMRLLSILREINGDAIKDLSKFRTAANQDQAVLLCQNSHAISVLASQQTREFTVPLACAQFFNKAVMNSSIIDNVLMTAARDNGNVNQMDVLLGNRNTPLSEVFSFIKANELFPKVYTSLLLQTVTTDFADYGNFYNAIEHSDRVANVIGMPVPQLKSHIMSEITTFLKQEDILN